MEESRYTQQIRAFRRRVTALYRSANTEAGNPALLTQAFEELQLALELIEQAEKQAEQEIESVNGNCETLRIEKQRFEELFENAPAGYFVTSVDGTIRKVNTAATKFLQSEERMLIGRPLALFIPEGERRAFRNDLAAVCQSDQIQRFQRRLYPGGRVSFDALMAVAPMQSRGGRPAALLWLIQPTITSDYTGIEPMGNGTARQRITRMAHTSTAPAEDETLGDTLPESLQSMQRKFAFLTEASLFLAVTHDRDVALAHLAQLAIPVFADLCLADVMTDDGIMQRVTALHANPARNDLMRHLQRDYPPQLDSAYGVAEVLRSGRSHLISHMAETHVQQIAQDTRHLEILRQLEPVSCIIVPLRTRGQMLGALTFVMADSHRHFNHVDLALAKELARRAAVAIDSGHRYHEASEQVH